MDAFFAAIEQRDSPELRGKAVIIGGDPHSRGVVSTCSYEARKFGVRSAMPSSQAHRLCPNGIFIPPRIEAYRRASDQIQHIFHQYTDLVEPLSLDEAYLDVTENKIGEPAATRIAQKIKQQILEETGLTASAGVSFNKFLAKVASDWNKPDGLTVIPPEKAPAFIDQLPIRKFFGIGAVTETRMIELGIRTGEDLKKAGRQKLIKYFGKRGALFWDIANCEDERPVNPVRERKSIGKEVTFEQDLSDLQQMIEILQDLSEKVERSLLKRDMQGKTITLKVRYQDFTTITRSQTLPIPIYKAKDILRIAQVLLHKTEASDRKVRLLGISVSNFTNRGYNIINKTKLTTAAKKHQTEVKA